MRGSRSSGWRASSARGRWQRDSGHPRHVTADGARCSSGSWRYCSQGWQSGCPIACPVTLVAPDLRSQLTVQDSLGCTQGHAFNSSEANELTRVRATEGSENVIHQLR
jgi:hypothetical protein